MSKPNLIDPSAGRVLVKVVCDRCGNRTVAVVQEYGRDGGRRLASYVGQFPDESGVVVGSQSVTADEQGPRLVLCPRHGALYVPTPGIDTERKGPRVVRAVPVQSSTMNS